LNDWASRCLQDLVAYFSPQPRFQVIDHLKGPVLTIATARAPSLVPCVESKELKYFFRIGDSTLRTPEYLIADEIMSNGVEMESGSNLFSGDSCWSLFLLLPHSLFQVNSCNSALASCKSFVSNPSVNQS
jgi:hypothetical protein